MPKFKIALLLSNLPSTTQEIHDVGNSRATIFHSQTGWLHPVSHRLSNSMVEAETAALDSVPVGKLTFIYQVPRADSELQYVRHYPKGDVIIFL